MPLPGIVRTSFADIEDKLRQMFRLVGDIGTDFTPDMKPVLIAGDLRDPGNTSYKGRRFAFGWPLGNAAIGTTASYGFTPGVDVVIDGMYVSGPTTAGNTVDVRLGASGAANAPVAMTQQIVAWTERPTLLDQFAPILATAGLVAGATGGNIIWSYTTTGSAFPGKVDVGMLVPAGGFINVRYNAVAAMATCSAAFFGRIY